MKKIYLVIIAVFSTLSILAQQNISGIVSNAQNGLPLEGVSVTVSGSTEGTFTNSSGEYSISAPSNSILEFSLLDFTTQRIAASRGPEINVSLAVAERSLREVVVVGYTTQTRRQATSSVTRVGGDQVKDQPIGSFEQLLQGRSPGLLVQSQSGQPGSAAAVTIRGKGSVLGSTQPLYIMDGVQISAADFQGINPSDIESYSVLKDAMGTAQYGSRGANGVIVITTKRGKNQKATVNYDVQYGIGELPQNKLQLMSSAEKIDYELNYDRPDGTNPHGWSQEEADSLSQVKSNLREVLFRRSATIQHQLSVEGGTNKTRFFISGSIFNQEGVVITTGLKRYTGRVNLDHNFGNFRLGLNTYIGSSVFSNTNENDEFIGSPLNALRWANPYVTPYLPDGSYNELDLLLQGQPNAVKELVENPVKNRQLKLIGSINLEYRFPQLKGLSVRTNYGIDHSGDENEFYFDRSTYQGQQQTGSNGSFGKGYARNTRHTLTTSLSYNGESGDHRYSISLFNELINRKASTFGFTGYGLVGPFKNGSGITPGTSTNGYIPAVMSDESENAILSYFAIGDYSYKNKYFITGTVRRDGSSRLADNNKWATFGAVGLSWLLSSEKFMEGTSWLNTLKLKTSYGSSANQGVGDDYEAMEQFGPISYNGVGGLILTNLKKGNLTWEVRRTLNAGLEFGLFKNRVEGSLEYYNSRTVGLFLNRQISGTNGTNAILTNLGKLENKGIEVALNLGVIRSRSFNWTVGGNFTYNKNTVLQLDGTNENADVNTFSINRIGEAANSIYLVRYAGVDPETGDALYYTNDGAPTNVYDPNDKVIVGKYDPPYFGGINSSFQYKNIEASVLFTYSFGNKIFNVDRVNVENPGYYVSNVSRDLLTEWRNPGDITNIPSSFSDFQPYTTRFLEDGKYWRLRNITLAYKVNSFRLGKHEISGARVFLQGHNLFTWSNFKGYDPEIATGLLIGAQYPALKVITIGASVTF